MGELHPPSVVAEIGDSTAITFSVLKISIYGIDAPPLLGDLAATKLCLLERVAIERVSSSTSCCMHWV